MLAAERPDLALLSGDQVSGFAYPAHDLLGHARRLGAPAGAPHSWYEEQWRRVIEPLHEAGVPYASVLGNHE